MSPILLTILLAAGHPETSPPEMSVAAYLEIADRLRAKGLGAMFSSEFTTLNTEIGRASASLKAERLDAEHRGRRAAYCPRGGVHMTAEEIYTAMASVRGDRRRGTTVIGALRAAFVGKYPCH
jgi:hypothetical protein